MSHSPTSLLISLYLAEFVFGLLYALLIHWIAVNGWLKGNTAWSVVVGDGATLFIQWLFFPTEWSPLVTFLCFSCSGAPMAISYLMRHQMQVEQKKEKHVRRPWPTRAAEARDDALMELSSMIHEIECTASRNEINAGFLLSISNRMHGVKKTLTSV